MNTNTKNSKMAPSWSDLSKNILFFLAVFLLAYGALSLSILAYKTWQSGQGVMVDDDIVDRVA